MRLQTAINRGMTKEAIYEVECIVELCLEEQHNPEHSTQELARNVLALIDTGVPD